MMRSLFSAISGLRNHMSYMDVVGNNIANVNTTAFKSSRVTFQDILSQNIRGAGGPIEGGRGGTNPSQIGLGMTLGGIDNLMMQGSIQSTGKLTDFAIQGDGFFVVSDGEREFYTRDGAFDVGVDGTLVNPANGLRVMGWVADAGGEIDMDGNVEPVSIPFGTRIDAVSTGEIQLQGNLNAATLDEGIVSTTLTVYDALGNAHTVRLELEKQADNQWQVQAYMGEDGDGNPIAVGGTHDIEFADGSDPDVPAGHLIDGDTMELTLTDLVGGADDLTFDIDFTRIRQYAASSQLNVARNDGLPSGALVSFAVSQTGEIAGIYSNGAHRTIGQLAMAGFTNPAGLERQGENLWSPSANSGDAMIGRPGEDGRGIVNTGTLESSNVDLAEQFTNMITAQRGFQSNSRVITATDTMLQDLVNIIR